jgi:hypothetical protein
MVIEVGRRLGEKGLASFGIDETNELISQGRNIASIQPGVAIMKKRGEDNDSVRLGFVGFKVNVLFADE